MTTNKTDGTKGLKSSIRHCCVFVKSKKSIWALMVSFSSFTFELQHGALLHEKRIMSQNLSFLIVKTK